MQIEKPESNIGAIVTGVDVNRLSDAEWQALYQAWLDSNVLVVRDQVLTLEQFLTYSRRFGRLKPHPARVQWHPDHPEITLMGVNTKTSAGKVNDLIYNRGANWHSDSAWDVEICKGTQLYGLAIPSYGGDTRFANMYAAYNAIPDGLKRRIEPFEAEFGYGGKSRQGVELLEPRDIVWPPAVHRIVRVHSETKRKALYFNPLHILRIVGLPDAESEAVIEELKAYMLQPGAEYRHKWKVGDIVLWDNRCTIHCATGGYPIEEKRIHWRTTIMESESSARTQSERAA